MRKFNLYVGSTMVTCNSYDEAAKIAKPFVEKGQPMNIIPIEVPKSLTKKEG